MNPHPSGPEPRLRTSSGRRRPASPSWSARMRVFAVTAVSAVGLGTALTAPAAAEPVPTPPCPGPGQTIMELQTDDPYVAVGTTKTQKLKLDLYTLTGCGATTAKATVRGPRSTHTVKLEVVSRGVEQVHWRGTLSIKPRSLSNADAGRWPTTFQVTGDNPDSYTVNSYVRRAVRISFNAGPEPVRGSRITYSGQLERASWDTHTYRDLARRQVSIIQVRLDEEDQDELAAVKTRADGTFRITRPYAGPGFYLARYEGTRYTSFGESRRDRVDTPR